jgi:hypothetical protein
MRDSYRPEGENLDRLLHATDPGDSPDGLRLSLLAQSSRLLRQRRRWRRAGQGMLLGACYVAGLLTTWLCMPSPGSPPTSILAEHPSLASRPNPPGDGLPAPAVDIGPEVPAIVLERLASANKVQRARFYRLAGDRYLEGEGDAEAALRCYGLALDADRRENLTISVDDTWLLMALKRARIEGKNHEKTGI